MKRVIVTGGAGFIGCNLVRSLLDDPSCTVLNLDKLTYAANLDVIEQFSSLLNYQFEQIDLATDSGRLTRIIADFSPDRIFHLAAESHVDRSIEGPDAFIQSNIVGTFNLLQATQSFLESDKCGRREKFLLVHMSTDEVYGSLSAREAKFTIDSPYRPRSPYSASKASSDHLVRAWQNTYHLPAVVVAATNTFGPHQHLEKLIPKAIHCVVAGESIPVYGDGTNVRDWIFVDDCVSALQAIGARGKVGSTYHVAADNELSNLKLIEQVVAITKQVLERRDRLASPPQEVPSPDPVRFTDDRPGHDFRYSLDTKSTSNALGWSASWDFEEALRTTVRHYVQILAASEFSTD